MGTCLERFGGSFFARRSRNLDLVSNPSFPDPLSRLNRRPTGAQNSNAEEPRYHAPVLHSERGGGRGLNNRGAIDLGNMEQQDAKMSVSNNIDNPMIAEDLRLFSDCWKRNDSVWIEDRLKRLAVWLKDMGYKRLHLIAVVFVQICESGRRWQIWRCGWGDGFSLLDQSAAFSIKLSILSARLVAISRTLASLKPGRTCGSRVASRICQHTVLSRSRAIGHPRFAMPQSCLKCSGETSASVAALPIFIGSVVESSGQARVRT